MRALILVAGAALAVAACSSNNAANNTMNVEENLTTENMGATEMNAPEMNATDMNATDMNAVDMNAIGKPRIDKVPVACSLRVSNAGRKDVPAHATPSRPPIATISTAPGRPVAIEAPRRTLTTRMTDDITAASMNSGTSSPARIEKRWMGVARSLSR